MLGAITTAANLLRHTGLMSERPSVQGGLNTTTPYPDTGRLGMGKEVKDKQCSSCKQ